MRVEDMIPVSPLDLNYMNSGFLPHIGLHRKSRLFVQESSFWHFCFFGVMSALALGALWLPWDQRVLLNLRLKYFVAIGCLCGGICGLVPYFIRNRYGQVITIDPDRKTVQIRQRNMTVALPMVAEKSKLPTLDIIVPWPDVVALQVCYQPKGRYSGYQLNLVRKCPEGIERHCLMQHALRTYVTRLAKKYQQTFGFRVLDHTNNSQQRHSI